MEFSLGNKEKKRKNEKQEEKSGKKRKKGIPKKPERGISQTKFHCSGIYYGKELTQ